MKAAFACVIALISSSAVSAAPAVREIQVDEIRAFEFKASGQIRIVERSPGSGALRSLAEALKGSSGEASVVRVAGPRTHIDFECTKGAEECAIYFGDDEPNSSEEAKVWEPGAAAAAETYGVKFILDGMTQRGALEFSGGQTERFMKLLPAARKGLQFNGRLDGRPAYFSVLCLDEPFLVGEFLAMRKTCRMSLTPMR
ncbi:MAG: hypothetical protein HY078_16305 [Elusimicrobia bacterium]|nr:hypothetical protein [Elusimicrobiota bacterium]